MKKQLITIILSVAIIGSIMSQTTTQQQIPSETVSVQVNTTTFLTGEYLYYSVYCNTAESVRGAKRSTIAYVALVSADQSEIFTHKIALKDGKGHSDFFIPNSVPSGSYKLIGYTNKTLNATTKRFFEVDIHIVNPYQADQDAIMGASEIVTKQKPVNSEKMGFNALELFLDKQQYGSREKVSAVLRNNSAENGFGTYTVSVRRLDPLPISESKSLTKTSNNDITFTPETEGHLFEGTLLSVASEAPIPNEPIAMSVPGDDFFFETSVTDAFGNFKFTLPTGIEGDIAYIQPLSSELNTYSVQPKKMQPIDYKQLAFSAFTITPEMKEDIVARSVANQIENAYFSEKPDTTTARASEKSFLYYEAGATYNLDDYTRFRTLEETFTEFVPSVYVSKNKNGEKEIRVFEKKFAAPTEDLPLFFVDGLWVRDAASLLNLDARTLQSLKVIRRGYQYANKDYFGVILITSKDVVQNRTSLSSSMQAVTLFKPQPFKTYFQQRYDDRLANAYSKIPDYRYQLLWLPAYVVKSAANNITFYTSDVSGRFEMVVTGYTNNGQKITLKRQFKVSEIAK